MAALSRLAWAMTEQPTGQWFYTHDLPALGVTHLTYTAQPVGISEARPCWVCGRAEMPAGGLGRLDPKASPSTVCTAATRWRTHCSTAVSHCPWPCHVLRLTTWPPRVQHAGKHSYPQDEHRHICPGKTAPRIPRWILKSFENAKEGETKPHTLIRRLRQVRHPVLVRRLIS